MCKFQIIPAQLCVKAYFLVEVLVQSTLDDDLSGCIVEQIWYGNVISEQTEPTAGESWLVLLPMFCKRFSLSCWKQNVSFWCYLISVLFGTVIVWLNLSHDAFPVVYEDIVGHIWQNDNLTSFLRLTSESYFSRSIPSSVKRGLDWTECISGPDARVLKPGKVCKVFDRTKGSTPHKNVSYFLLFLFCPPSSVLSL